MSAVRVVRVRVRVRDPPDLLLQADLPNDCKLTLTLTLTLALTLTLTCCCKFSK